MSGSMGGRRVASGLLLAALVASGPAAAGPPTPLPAGWSAEIRLFSGPRLGVRVQSMTPELRNFFDVEGEAGLLVASVEAKSPAARSGIEVGDVLVRAGDRALYRPRDLVRVVRSVSPGKTLRIDLIRERERKEIEVTLPEPDSDESYGWERPVIPPEMLGPYLAPELYGPSLDGALRRMRERLRELEQRLDDLERRLESGSPEGERT